MKEEFELQPFTQMGNSTIVRKPETLFCYAPIDYMMRKDRR